MAMNVRRLKQILQQQTGSDELADDYNYEVMTLQVPQARVPEVANALRERKERIEKGCETARPDGVALLGFVCLTRKRSILVPIPADASLNIVSGALDKALNGEFPGVQFPTWG